MTRNPRRLWIALAAAGALAGTVAVAHSPVLAAWHLRRAEAAERADDFAAADRHLTASRRYDPHAPAARLLAARLGWRSRVGDPLPAGDWEATLRRHLRAAEADPALTDQVVLEGQLLDALTGSYDRAAVLLNKRLAAAGPDDGPILEALAWGGVLAHRFPLALSALDRLLAARPDRAAGHHLRGLVRELSNGAAGSPEADYRRAFELARGHRGYRHALARSLLTSPGAVGEAMALFQALAAEDPADSKAAYGLGHCQLALGDHTAAAATLRAVAAARPGDGVAWAEYGQAVMGGGDPAAAEPLLRRGVELAPNARVTNHQFGLCLARLGRADEARRYLDAAERIYADDQRVNELSRELLAAPAAGAAKRCELGELLVRTGRTEQGRHWLESALATDPAYAPARAALASLDGVTSSAGPRRAP